MHAGHNSDGISSICNITRGSIAHLLDPTHAVIFGIQHTKPGPLSVVNFGTPPLHLTRRAPLPRVAAQGVSPTRLFTTWIGHQVWGTRFTRFTAHGSQGATDHESFISSSFACATLKKRRGIARRHGPGEGLPVPNAPARHVLDLDHCLDDASVAPCARSRRSCTQRSCQTHVEPSPVTCSPLSSPPRRRSTAMEHPRQPQGRPSRSSCSTLGRGCSGRRPWRVYCAKTSSIHPSVMTRH